MVGGDHGFMHTHSHEEFVMKDGITGAVFSDIFNAAYFIMMTITTVGYGDQTPQTSVGKGAAIVAMPFGAFFMAMPLAIIGNNCEQAGKALVRRSDASKALRTMTPTSFDTTSGRS